RPVLLLLQSRSNERDSNYHRRRDVRSGLFRMLDLELVFHIGYERRLQVQNIRRRAPSMRIAAGRVTDFSIWLASRHCPSPSNGSFIWRGSLGSPGPRQWRLRCRAARPLTCSPWATSRFVGEATALCAFDGQRRALHVINTALLTVAVAEIELREIAMQMRFADVLIGAVNAALQNRKEPLDGVGVDVAANVLIGTVLDRTVRSKIPADPHKCRGFIG